MKKQKNNREFPVILNLQIASKVKTIPKLTKFKLWVAMTLKEVVFVEEKYEITIRIVTPKESQKLNSTYRGKNYPTNVLSFSYKSEIKIEPLPLGDIVICADVMKKEAKQQAKSLESHWAHLVIHGTLHLLGYDHNTLKNTKIMEDLEIKILNKLGFASPY